MAIAAKKLAPFKNEPILDFSKSVNFNSQKEAITELRKKLGKTYEIIIGGKKYKTEKTFNSINPSNKDEVLATFYKGTTELVEKAVEVAYKTFQKWQFTTVEERASILFKAAEIIKQRRFDVNAYLILEAGKNYGEADADTAEAIDFLNFYAHEALRYGGKHPIVPFKGEKNELVYIPLGVCAVIPPWNFPFAILGGMTSAAIVAGNTVVLKPSSDTPLIGKLFYDIMVEAGLPSGVLNFLPGSGGEVGDTLVAHPKTRFIAFTGSMEVGIHINELAAKVQPGQIWLKRVIAEMGGKDSMIIDADCDIDAAVASVTAAAFGFQGQKCSACSRAIVDKSVYNEFVKKLKARVETLKVGPAEENFAMGPVIGESAMNGILEFMEFGRKEGKLLCGGLRADGNGFYLQPTVFIDIAPNAKLSLEEIFGPVLAVIKSKNFDDALKIANNTMFGLTGALYTNDRSKIERAKKELLIGNLYFNRKCTGALVGVHPFGGFNMSGTDSKAGGRDYLLLFTQAKLMSEKI